MADKLREMLKLHEKLSLKPYLDTKKRLTIGYGRCLDTFGITEEEAEMLLTNNILDVQKRLPIYFPWFEKLDPVRKDVVTMMAFNLGIAGFLEFKKTLEALEAGDFQAAGDRMLESVWSRQVGERSIVLFKMMKSGEYPNG